MPGQHIENLFRRFKGEVVDVKTISGGIYSGRISEITNDYVCLTETQARAWAAGVFIIRRDRVDSCWRQRIQGMKCRSG